MTAPSTSANEPRSLTIVARPSATARANVPEDSPALGYRRFTTTSTAFRYR